MLSVAWQPSDFIVGHGTHNEGGSAFARVVRLCLAVAINEMKQPTQIIYIESRWLVVLVVVAVFFLLAILPGRLKTFPAWVPFPLVIGVILPMAALRFATARTRWLRIETIALLAFLLLTGFALIANLKLLLFQMIHRSGGLNSLTLLESSVAVWVSNLLLFSLAYWRMDRGGPEARANQVSTKPDWFFPQEGATDKAANNWRPTFVDYLFLAFCTATAFSPTDVMPLTSRAKVLMMVESAISLVTIIAVVARAINTLGT